MDYQVKEVLDQGSVKESEQKGLGSIGSKFGGGSPLVEGRRFKSNGFCK